MINKELLKMLVCPVSKGELEYNEETQELICEASGLAYPIQDDIPVMIREEARTLESDRNYRTKAMAASGQMGY